MWTPHRQSTIWQFFFFIFRYFDNYIDYYQIIDNDLIIMDTFELLPSLITLSYFAKPGQDELNLDYNIHTGMTRGVTKPSL